MVRVSLVHDWLVDSGGAEKCLQSLLNIYPDAYIYTLFYKLETIAALGINPDMVIASTLQTKRSIAENYRRKLAFFPYHIEQFSLNDTDIIISSSHCVAKGIMARSDQLHFCYCHTPMRYAWDISEQFLSSYNLDIGVKSRLTRWLFHYLRNWDIQSSNRVDYFIASSRTVAQRIWRAYRRRADVIYPPVDTDKFVPRGSKGDYFIFVSRLVPAKMATLVIETFNQNKMPLKVVGTGPQLEMYRKLANANVEVMDYLPDKELAALVAKARALVFPVEDDFGIVPVEAQAAGTPVIALARGGARETVTEATGHNWDEATGILFNEPTVESLSAAIKQFRRWEERFKTEVLTGNAQRFSKARYEQEMRDFINMHYREWQGERVV